MASCGHPEVGAGQHLPGQRPVEQPGGAVDGVALRHASRSPLGVETKPAAVSASRSGVAPAAEQLLAVGLLDREPAQRAAARGLGERLRPPG